MTSVYSSVVERNYVLWIKYHDQFVFSALTLSSLGWGLTDEELPAISLVGTGFQNQVF